MTVLAPMRGAVIPAQRSARRVDLVRPPRTWFDNPQLSEPTPMTYTADGRVYGHMALWKSCHTGFLNGQRMQCLRPPRSATGYRYFQLGRAETDTGEQLPVGKITVGAPHASVIASSWGAISHYDNAALVAAVVVPYEDRWGIALAGARTPDATDTQWAMARRSPVSGDWRLLDGGLELIASLGVNSPGFPVPIAGSTVLLSAGVMPTWEQLITWEVARAVQSGLTPQLARQLQKVW